MRSGRQHSVAKSLALVGMSSSQRTSLVVLVCVALALVVLSVLRPSTGEGVRTHLTDAFVPLLSTITAPVTKVAGFVSALGSLTELRAENERLMVENERLRQYQTAVMRLEAENKGLRDLLKMQTDPLQRRITARVVADVGGPFMRNVVLLAGWHEGVREGMVALAGGGIAGRVVSVGRASSRVLLVNDINARVPVVLEDTRQRGLVEGDNTQQLRLTSLPPDVVPVVGQRLVTSGVGGIYPAGLPVGVVSHQEGGVIRVEPLADLGRLEIVEILDSGLPDGVFSPEKNEGLEPRSDRK